MDSVFVEQATIWDTEYRINRARIISNKIKASISISNRDYIIDFGAATGLIGLNFNEIVNHMTFIERSNEMRKVLDNKIKILDISKIELFSDLFDTGLVINGYDLILSSMVFHHVKDIKGTGERLFELLKPGKKLCIIDLMPDDGSFHETEKDFAGYNGFDPTWLSEQFKGCGFKYGSHEVVFRDIKNNGNKEYEYSLFMLLMEK